MTAAIWVHRFDLREPADQPTVVMLPEHAEIVHVAEQHGTFAMWFTNPDTDSPNREPRWFQIYGTGHEIDTPDWLTSPTPRGTALFHGGRLVLHLIEFLPS